MALAAAAAVGSLFGPGVFEEAPGDCAGVPRIRFTHPSHME